MSYSDLYNMHSDLYSSAMICLKVEKQGEFHRSADVDFPYFPCYFENMQIIPGTTDTKGR